MAIYSAGRRRTILILLLTSVLLITLDLRGNAVFNAVRSGFEYAFRPFEIAAEVLTRPVDRVWKGMTEVDDLEREVERLQETVDSQRQSEIAGDNALIENRELRDLLDIESVSNFPLVQASIIGSSPSNFDQRVEIDAGSTDGLRIGMPVVNSAGLVGKITQDLNLDAAGLKADKRGRLEVNAASFQTSVPHIYAAGDVIGFPSLASTSMEQGRIAACRAFEHPAPDAPAFFPYGIYAVPEMSTIGKTEEELREEGIGYEAGVARFRETSRGHIMGLDTGLLKMLFALGDRRLLGVHIVGEGATELIHIGQAVLNLHGTLDYFVENTFNYPTLAEAYKIAALDAWNRMEPG
jgi:hypothetical protein